MPAKSRGLFVSRQTRAPKYLGRWYLISAQAQKNPTRPEQTSEMGPWENVQSGVPITPARRLVVVKCLSRIVEPPLSTHKTGESYPFLST